MLIYALTKHEEVNEGLEKSHTVENDVPGIGFQEDLLL